MLRLFVGLELPDLHRQRLALVKSPLPGAKWVDPDDMHITIRFLGDIDNAVAEDFAGLMDALEADPFEIVLGEIAAFGGREPRIILARAEGGEALSQLNRSVERAARAVGLDPETRRFEPHVTLARLRGTKPEAVARFLGSRAPLGLPSFRVERFVLFSSRPKVGGGPYVVEEAFGLGR